MFLTKPVKNNKGVVIQKELTYEEIVIYRRIQVEVDTIRVSKIKIDELLKELKIPEAREVIERTYNIKLWKEIT